MEVVLQCHRLLHLPDSRGDARAEAAGFGQLFGDGGEQVAGGGRQPRTRVEDAAGDLQHRGRVLLNEPFGGGEAQRDALFVGEVGGNGEQRAKIRERLLAAPELIERAGAHQPRPGRLMGMAGGEHSGGIGALGRRRLSLHELEPLALAQAGLETGLGKELAQALSGSGGLPGQHQLAVLRRGDEHRGGVAVAFARRRAGFLQLDALQARHQFLADAFDAPPLRQFALLPDHAQAQGDEGGARRKDRHQEQQDLPAMPQCAHTRLSLL